MIKADSKKYKDFSFDDIASNISERVEPHDTDLDIYVGLEHLNPECIHIERRGVPADVKGVKLRVHPGDIIFGKRRAYQRKAGLVDFDGICSAHAMVVRANSEVILPELFPFFIHSDVFMHRAVDVSEGSLSPTIKWKIFAEEKFKLPPLTEQKRLADLLWSVDETIEKWKKLKNSLNNLYMRIGQDFFLGNKQNKEQLNNVAHINMGQSPPGKAYNEDGEGIPFLQGNAEFGDVFPKYVKSTRIATKMANTGDILLSVRAPVGAINISDRQYCIGRGLSAISMKDRDLNDYLKHALIFLKPEMERISTGSTFKAINKKSVESLEIPFAKKSIIVALGKKLERMNDSIKQLNQHVHDSKEIQKQIINQIFG